MSYSNNTRLGWSAILAASALLVACAPADDGTANEESGSPDGVTPESSLYSDAINVPTRLVGDYERDEARKPDQVLEFFGVEPGMVVLDLFSGGGYYSEMIAHVVGADGRVDAHTNRAYISFAGDEFKSRYADDRLPNASVLMAENNELSLDTEHYDAVTMILSYHDLYFTDEDAGWPTFDIPKLHAEIMKGLKPGGILGIVDHHAAPGSPASTGSTVHRIDPAIVIRELTDAGFVFEGQSDLLESENDDFEKGIFDAEVRGRTSRFVLLFRKPG